MSNATWTSIKNRLQPGAKIYLHNIRRPWLSRHAVVEERSRRYMQVLDGESRRSNVLLPAAAFTHVVDANEVELLAKKDGPLFDDNRQKVGAIAAGQPFLTLRIVADVGEK